MRLHVVDGTFEIYRAHFSKRPGHLSPSGQDVKATVGLLSSMFWLLEDEAEAVSHVAIAFDNPIASFRNDLFAAYKSDEGVPPEIRGQFDLAEEAMRAIGIVVWSMGQWEADDALATAAARFGDAVDQVRILTPDKDLGQCVRGREIVQVDRIRKRVIDEAGVRAGWGVAPRSIPDLLALMGDSADGIPGIAGFGAKTAAVLLASFGTIEAIPDDPRAWLAAGLTVRGADRLAATLRDQRANALLYKKLATLVEDVPLPQQLDELEWQGVPRGAFADLRAELGLDEKWNDRPKRWASGSSLDA